MKKRNEIPLWARTGHRRPVTRREFLNAGIIPFFAWGVAPSISSLITRSAFAASCEEAAAASFIPFITLNLSGGASLSGNVVPKKMTGDYLSNYSRIGGGLGPLKAYNITTEFGSAEFPGIALTGGTQGQMVGRFLVGVRDPLNTNTGIVNPALAKSAFVSQCLSSNDDSSMNSFDVTGLVLKMGLKGTKLANLGRVDNATGINAQPAMVPPPAPFVVGNVNDLAGALGYTSGMTNLKIEQKGAIARLIASLTTSQIKRISEVPGAQATQSMIECVGIKNADLVATGGGDVDPFAASNAVNGGKLATAWGLNINNINRGSQDAVFAAMVYNGIMGNAATVNLNIGGYDYHDNTRATGDGRDQVAGQVVGKILATAEAFQKPVFIYVCSDGSVTSADTSTTPDSVWVSDRGIAGMQYMISSHPGGRPTVTSNQIGGFTDNQAVDGEFPTGNSIELASQGIFANYAALNGQFDFLKNNRILGDDSVRAKVIKFVPKAG